MANRTMTIARGLTRLKTISAQLDDIAAKIGQHGALSNKSRSALGETGSGVALAKNQAQAQEAVNALFQSFNDLKLEYVRIKLAIDRANIATTLTVAGKTMTVQEALIYRRDLSAKTRAVISQYGNAVSKAERAVNQFNNNINVGDMTEDQRQVLMADVLYLVPRERVSELDKFIIEFLTELDGTLNEVNALTQIEIVE